jgi:hypothetical protein
MFKGADAFFTRIRAWGLKKQVLGTATDKMIELLLKGMDLFFYVTWDDDFRRHLKNFDGRYYFKTEDETVKVSATFSNGDMHVHDGAIDDWDVMVTFKNGEALRKYIFSNQYQKTQLRLTETLTIFSSLVLWSRTSHEDLELSNAER